MLRPPAYAYVDAAYIRESLTKRSLPWSRVSLRSLAELALQCADPVIGELRLYLARTFVYDAVAPNGSMKADEIETWLSRNDRERDTHVRRGITSGEARLQQKGVDIQLAIDALGAALRRNFEAAVLVTGDADFFPLAEAIRLAGPQVLVVGFKDSMADVLRRLTDRVGYFPENLPATLFFPDVAP